MKLKFIIFTFILYCSKFFKRIKYLISYSYYKNYHLTYSILKGVKIEEDALFIGHSILHFDPKASISIGKEFICRSGSEYSIDNFSCSKIMVNSNAKLTIGDFSGISNTVIQCHNHINIGSYVNIGAGCMIMDSNFHSTNWQERKDRNKDVSFAKSSPINIGNYSFIGARSIICKGVTIGEKVIIAAGSVVVNNIPDGEIWGGNPAKFIRKID